MSDFLSETVGICRIFKSKSAVNVDLTIFLCRIFESEVSELSDEIDWKSLAESLGISKNDTTVEKMQVVTVKIDTSSPMSKRELTAKEELIKFTRYQCKKRLELLVRRAFDDGVIIREIKGGFYLCFNWRTRKYMKNLNAVMKSDVEICTQEISDTFWMIYFLATIVPDGEGVKYLKDNRIPAREEYRKRLLTPEMQKSIYDNTYDYEDADLLAKKFPQDSKLWIKLFRITSQTNKELTEILQYVRACKATLKSHSRYGYYIDRSLFSEKSKETYDKHIKPYFEKHSAELFAALKEIAN